MSFVSNPLLKLSREELKKAVVDRPSMELDKPKKQRKPRKTAIPPKPTTKPPRVSKKMLMDRVKKQRDADCGKYKNISKMSMKQLQSLLK